MGMELAKSWKIICKSAIFLDDQSIFCPDGGFPSHGGTPKWMLSSVKSQSKMDDVWGYHHFRKPPYFPIQKVAGLSGALSGGGRVDWLVTNEASDGTMGPCFPVTLRKLGTLYQWFPHFTGENI